MIEEYIVKKIEELATKTENFSIQEEGVEGKKSEDGYVEVDSSYSYKEIESRLNNRELIHYQAMLLAMITMLAIETKIIKSKKARQLSRKFLLSGLGGHVRNQLFRKGGPGVSSGLLRRDQNTSHIFRTIAKNRLPKMQAMSVGPSMKALGLTSDKMSSDALNKLISISLALEEFSPAKIGRTLSLSHMLQSKKMSNDMPTYHITGDEMDKMGSYYHSAAEKYGKGRVLTPNDTKLGLFYHQNKILGAMKDASGNIVPNIDDVVIKSAIPVFTQTDLSNKGLDKSINQIFRKAIIEEGLAPRVLDDFNNSQGTNKIGFVFGGNKLEAWKNMSTAYVSKMFESGSRAVDSVFGLADEVIESKIAGMKNPNSKRVAENLYGALGLRFGSGTLSSNRERLIYDRKLGEQLKSLTGKMILKPIGFTAGALAVNSFIGSTFGDDYRVENVAGEILAKGHMLYAKTFSDGFLKDIKERQEEIMPGSTGIAPIIGLISSAAVTGATVSYAKSLYEKSRFGIAEGEIRNAKNDITLKPVSDFLKRTIGPRAGSAIDDALSSIKKAPVIGGFLSQQHGRSVRWGLAGALMGAIASIPILPGAIAGTDSETLERQYSGEEKVAVRSNRGWLMGGESIDGGKIKYFDKHWYAKQKEDATTATLYGDAETKDKMNPLLHPFSYLSDPYQFEKRNEENLPFPVWGMDVTYGGFIGEAFEATLGRIIKPTIINPELQNYLAETNKEGEYKIKKTVEEEEAQLIAEGKMLSPIAPSVEISKDALKKSAIGAFDFGGFKGFISQSLISGSGYTDPLLTVSSLEVSGSATSLARQIKESNLGDIGTFGEAQRRIINTGADSLAGRKENPLRNKMASWLPGDKSDYYIDFQHGNPYGKIENAATRLPGVGYARFNKELQGVDVEDYPLVNRYEILSDVALGSKEYYQTKRDIENRRKKGALSEEAESKIRKIDEYTEKRSESKTFRDDFSAIEISGKFGVLAGVGRAYWDTVSGAAQSPLESVSPLRFGSKFIHDRTDIEDYKKNVTLGSDMALWTRPLDHFIGSTVVQTLDAVGGEGIELESVTNKRAIDQYFDRLEFYKQRQLYKHARDEGNLEEQRSAKSKYEGTKIGALNTGLNSTPDIYAAMRSMKGLERSYFDSFAMKQDESKREEIADMVSSDDEKIYRQLWANRDYLETVESEEELRAFQKDDISEYERRMEEAELESLQFMSETLGVPNVDFSGWDPRIQVDDVKLRFLQLSGQEVRDHGFWRDDEIEMLRKTAILDDKNISGASDGLNKLISKYKEKDSSEFIVRQSLMKQNVHAREVEVRDGNGSFEFIQE